MTSLLHHLVFEFRHRDRTTINATGESHVEGLGFVSLKVKFEFPKLSDLLIYLELLFIILGNLRMKAWLR